MKKSIITSDHTKICNECGEDKDFSEYHKDKYLPTGYRVVCKKCRSDKNKTDPKIKEYEKKRYLKNKEKSAKESHEYYLAHKEELLLKSKKVRYKNKKKQLARDPTYRIKENLRTRIRAAFKQYSKNGKAKTSKEYGIDFDAIYKKVGPRPSEDYQLDHIIPLCYFDFDNSEHVRMSNSPENLQWLKGSENRLKHTTIPDIAFELPELINILKLIGVIND